MKFPRMVMPLLVLLSLAACSKPAPVYNDQLYVFGTLVDITIVGPSPELAQQAFTEISHDFQRMHGDWHAWQPGALTDLNRAIKQGKSHKVDDFLLPLIQQSKTLYQQSEGMFNPAIGQLIGLWGFHSSGRPTGPPPSKKAIAALVARNPTMDDVKISGNLVSSRNRAVQFDFGAFAKGYAIDLALARMRKLGIENAMVNAGGDLRVIGKHGDRPWRIGIRHPSGKGVLASVEAKNNEAVFTSGNYERYREYEGKRRSHIIDPRDGLPVDHVVSVTVIHPNGAVADAAATALTVAGPKDWHRIARKMGIHYVLLMDGEGRVHMNPAMAERIRFEEGNEPEVVLSGVL
jgi:thiamine biosynthesis lipoprotein